MNKNNIKNLEAITAIEVFEHLEDPVSEIKKLLSLSETIIFSTQLLPKPIPNPGDWWFYAFDHGQHISFYSSETLQKLAGIFSLNTYSFGSLHLLTRKKLSKKQVKLFLKFSQAGLFFYITKKMKSKTWSDHLFLQGGKNN